MCVFVLQGYMRPLKQPENSPLVDPSLVDEMFFQIPEILDHHEHFLEQVLSCVNDWHDKQTVGHLLIESVSGDVALDEYLRAKVLSGSNCLMHFFGGFLQYDASPCIKQSLVDHTHCNTLLSP